MPSLFPRPDQPEESPPDFERDILLSDHPWDMNTRDALGIVETGWTPRFEYGIPSDRPLGEIEPNDGSWMTAPISSHISRFRYSNAKTNSLTRKFGRVIEGGSSDNPYARGASQLDVIFKGPNNAGESAEYNYFFNDHDQGQAIYDSMLVSDHPYSSVLYPRVVIAGIPYQRASAIE